MDYWCQSSEILFNKSKKSKLFWKASKQVHNTGLNSTNVPTLTLRKMNSPKATRQKKKKKQKKKKTKKKKTKKKQCVNIYLSSQA